MSERDPSAQPWIVSAAPADGSAHPYSRMVTATGARSAIREAAGATALNRIAALVAEWDARAATEGDHGADILSEIAAIVAGTGRETGQS